MKPGPITRSQLKRLGSVWKQGEHVLVTGPTGSGKTALARHIIEQRADNRGFVIVFVMKLSPDETILQDYRGFTRWKRMRKSPNPAENRILLWPDTKGLAAKDALKLQREVFLEAMDILSQVGRWTVQCDEGLYTVSPYFLNLGSEWAMLHAMGRSSKLTLVTLAQRPAHLPLIVYSSASHAFIGRMRESADLKRLAELGSQESSKELAALIAGQTRHDFVWAPIAADWPAEKVNLKA